jgi:hypothetical protein
MNWKEKKDFEKAAKKIRAEILVPCGARIVPGANLRASKAEKKALREGIAAFPVIVGK